MGGRCRLFLLFCSTAGVAGWTPLPSLPKLVSSRSVPRPAGALCATSVQQHDSKRAKRRRRAPPSELQQWMAVLSERPGGLKLLLDLDNNADAVPQLEAAEVQGLIGSCDVVGFAGVDYEGPAPPWMKLRRCRVRTKNGAGIRGNLNQRQCCCLLNVYNNAHILRHACTLIHTRIQMNRAHMRTASTI